MRLRADHFVMKHLSTAILTIVICAGCARDASHEAEWASGVPETEKIEATAEPRSGSVFEALKFTLPKPGFYFSVGSEKFPLAQGPAYKWNRCDPQATVNGGYDSDTECGGGYFQEGFATHLQDDFF